MRFTTSTSPPPPLRPAWRLILWVVLLAPAVLLLTWSLQHARTRKPDPVLAGRSADETRRLARILQGPQPGPSATDAESIRVVSGLHDAATIAARLTNDDLNLDRSQLAIIDDNAFGLTSAESPVYDAVLSKLRHVSVSDLERIAHRDIPFAVLMLDADRYRGEVLTVEGDVRRVRRIDARTAAHDSRTTYEAWLFTADSGLHPYRIVVNELPEGLPLSDRLDPPIRARATGYFFKRYSYATTNSFHTAPLLLANTLTPLARQKSPSQPPRHRSPFATVVTVLAIALVFVVGGFVATRRKSVRPNDSRLRRND